jgi:lipopolysaccharide/colanic/teichoic acid biosynthesis glycosyltransferase
VGNLVTRLFDIIVSLIGLLLLSPFFLLIGILIRRDSPGPIFYRGPRLGRGGKPFKILKFRTMYECDETYQGPPITACDDDRITPVGRWLRDTKLNEFPQLWNVLVGEMSLVGPRPEDPEVAATWSKEVLGEVLSLRPGVTSPASVLYRNEESLLRADQVMASYLDTIVPSKLRLDQLYVRNHSFWLDLDIIFWTFIVLLPSLGKVSPPEDSLFWGPVSRLVRRYLDWFVIDTLVTFAALGVVGALWRFLGPLDIGWSNAIITAVGFSFLFSLAGVLMGVNRITWSRAMSNDAIDLLPPVLLATVMALAGNYFWEPHQLPTGMILAAAGMAFMGFVGIRYRSRLLWFASFSWPGAVEAMPWAALIIGGGRDDVHQLAVVHRRNAPLYRVVGLWTMTCIAGARIAASMC